MRNLGVHIRQSDDWIALYLHGRKVYEGHSLDPKTLLELLEISFDSVYFDLADTDDFPEQIGDTT